ncbi:MAG: hypothetical protein KDF64_02870 [Geminicoccaceae bacterium]|nr:hypothetical protein [Geminicoccaceae bacterium]
MLVVSCSLSAGGYLLAAIVMKYWFDLPLPVAVGLILLSLGIAIGFEIRAMMESDLALTILTIIGFETVLAFLFGHVLFGETVRPLQCAGVVLVLAGVMLVQLPVSAP